MANLFVKVKSVFSRSKNQGQSSINTSTSSSSDSSQPSETAAPSYHHAAAAQPPAYQPIPPQPQHPASSHSDTPPTTFQQQAREIAKIQVGGLKRNVGAGGASSYFTSYAPTQPTGPPSSVRRQGTGQTTDTSYGHGANNAPGSGEKDMHLGASATASSTGQGKPTRAAYGHEQELSEEDEEMWARLAM